jgi:hypothetical protein
MECKRSVWEMVCIHQKQRVGTIEKWFDDFAKCNNALAGSVKSVEYRALYLLMFQEFTKNSNNKLHTFCG